MFFKNLTIFQFPVPAGWVEGTADKPGLNLAGRLVVLEDFLRECALKPVGAAELMSRGWVPPLGRGSEALAHTIGDATWICLGTEERILPSAAVNAELAKRIAAIEDAEGRRLGGRARKRLKEDVVLELLPRALVRPSRLNAYIDARRGLVFVDTASRKAAEGLVSELRHALGSFPALPLHPTASVRQVLTGWLAGDPTGIDLSLGDEAELRDPSEAGAMVKVSRLEFPSDELEAHIEAGFGVVRLGLVYQDRVRFVVDEGLTLRKVKFLEGALEALDGTEREDVQQELDARFALMAAELGRLYDVLGGCFQFAPVEPEV